MEIVPSKNFRDARIIPDSLNKFDPRSASFSESQVIVNLRECCRVHPSAIVWSAVYLLLAKQRGSNCFLLGPSDASLSSYLRAAGLYSVLCEEGVGLELYDETSGFNDIITPLIRFNGLNEAEIITNLVWGHLTNSMRGSSNIYSIIYENFSELANNAAEHSKSEIGSFGFVKAYSSGQKRWFVFVVADGGVGIRHSLDSYMKSHMHHGYPWEAIALSVRELVSGTASKTRGIGLFSALEDAKPKPR